MTFAEKVISFNASLSLEGVKLPGGIKAMNPFKESPEAVKTSETFYRKFYNDNNPRYFIIGINPGRFGAGVTGVPFTDPKRLISECGIPYSGKLVHEPSSVFVYEMIHAYGGVEAFYASIYINSMSPLGFTKDKNGRHINYNYYDSEELYRAVKPFIIKKLQEQIAFGVNTDKVFCMGTGKNYRHLSRLNEEYEFFREIIPLPHPRYIVQYKQAEKENYIKEYLDKLK